MRPPLFLPRFILVLFCALSSNYGSMGRALLYSLIFSMDCSSLLPRYTRCATIGCCLTLTSLNIRYSERLCGHSVRIHPLTIPYYILDCHTGSDSSSVSTTNLAAHMVQPYSPRGLVLLCIAPLLLPHSELRRAPLASIPLALTISLALVD